MSRPPGGERSMRSRCASVHPMTGVRTSATTNEERATDE
jgi:hypothetical protein